MANNPLYTNAGGTGDRTASITVTVVNITVVGAPSKLVNGVTSGATDFYYNSSGIPGAYIRFDFGAGASKLITEAKYYQENTTNQAVMQWQGSNNGSDWTDIGAQFQLGGVATQTITTLSGNAAGYRYYQLIQRSGNMNGQPYVYEFEFKIDDFAAASTKANHYRRRRAG